MINIKIADQERQFNNIKEIEESWINQQINRRQSDNQIICVRIRLNIDSINVSLCTPTCVGGSGGGREPNEKESDIIDLWNKHGLNLSNFTGGNLVAFIKQLKKYIN